jgi:SAM-dependent methyltransferase
MDSHPVLELRRAELGEGESLLLLVCADGQPVGEIHFDRLHDGACAVAVHLVPELTGRCLGATALVEGCRLCVAAWPDVAEVRAHVRDDNAASLGAFAGAGFRDHLLSDAPAGHRLLVWRPDAPFARIAGYYDALVERHGDSPHASDYGSARSQAAKFAALADVSDLRGKRVLDVGCGLATFADHLAARYPGCEYVGLDLSPRTIALARRLRPHLDLRCGNLLELAGDERFDVVTANGIFYLLGDDAPALMRELVGRMWALADEAVAFNSLSTWAPDRAEGEFQADPLETVAFCRELSPRVVLRHDYLPHDFTVHVHRVP